MNETPPTPPAPPVPPGVSGETGELSLVITVADGKLSVNGPLHDSIWCYGVLERAKDVIREIQRRASGSPGGMTPSGLVIPKGGFKPPGS